MPSLAARVHRRLVTRAATHPAERRSQWLACSMMKGTRRPDGSASAAGSCQSPPRSPCCTKPSAMTTMPTTTSLTPACVARYTPRRGCNRERRPTGQAGAADARGATQSGEGRPRPSGRSCFRGRTPRRKSARVSRTASSRQVLRAPGRDAHVRRGESRIDARERGRGPSVHREQVAETRDRSGNEPRRPVITVAAAPPAPFCSGVMRTASPGRLNPR